MDAMQSMNPAQVEVMNMMSFVNSDNAWLRMKEAIADYFAKQLDEEICAMWKDGTLTDEKVQSFSNLHERTPYK